MAKYYADDYMEIGQDLYVMSVKIKANNYDEMCQLITDLSGKNIRTNLVHDVDSINYEFEAYIKVKTQKPQTELHNFMAKVMEVIE